MAQSMVDEILSAEAKARQTVDSAEQRARQILAEAKEKGEKLIGESRAQAQNEARQRIAAQMAENDRLKQQAQTDAVGKKEELARAAEQHRPQAVQAAIGILRTES